MFIKCWVYFLLYALHIKLQGILKEVKVAMMNQDTGILFTRKYLPTQLVPSWTGFLLTEVLRNPLNLHKQILLESLYFFFLKMISHKHMIRCPLFLGDFNQASIHSYLFVSLPCARLCKTKMEKTWMCLHESYSLNTMTWTHD